MLLGPCCTFVYIDQFNIKKYISKSFLCDLSKKKLFLWEKKRSCLCEARTHDIHVSTMLYHTETAPPVYHGGPKANKQAFNSAQTSWEHDYVGLAQVHPNYEVYSWVEILSNLLWSSPGMMHSSVGRSLAWQNDSATSSQVIKLYRIINLYRVRSWTQTGRLCGQTQPPTEGSGNLFLTPHAN